MIIKDKLDNLMNFIKDQGRILEIKQCSLDQIILETASNIRFTFPSHTSQLELIRRVTKEVANLMAIFTEEEMDDIGLAIDEACTNVIHHSYGFNPKGEILVEFKMEPTQFTVILTDKGEDGQFFNPESLSPVDREEYMKAMTKGGLGVFLIKKIMDDVEYTVSPGVQNCLRMVKYAYPVKRKA